MILGLRPKGSYGGIETRGYVTTGRGRSLGEQRIVELLVDQLRHRDHHQLHVLRSHPYLSLTVITVMTSECDKTYLKTPDLLFLIYAKKLAKFGSG